MISTSSWDIAIGLIIADYLVAGVVFVIMLLITFGFIGIWILTIERRNDNQTKNGHGKE